MAKENLFVKPSLINFAQKVLAEKYPDKKVTKISIEQLFDDLDTIIEALAGAEGLDSKGLNKTKLGNYIELTKVFVPGKAGTMKRQDRTTGELINHEYETKDHNVVKIKAVGKLVVE